MALPELLYFSGAVALGRIDGLGGSRHPYLSYDSATTGLAGRVVELEARFVF